MTNGHNPVPLLGQKQKVKAPPPLWGTSIIRDIDENGLVDCANSVLGPNNQVVGMVGRNAYLDGTQLLKEIRAIVREEIAAALKTK